MTGKFLYRKGDNSHIALMIDGIDAINGIDGNHLYFDDARRFGNVQIVTGEGVAAHLQNLKLGPDVLEHSLRGETKWIPAATWQQIFRKPSIQKWSLCKALLDQKLVAGIGNYLKSEIMYYAGLHPERQLLSLSDTDLERLRVCAHKIILLSYSYNGLTIENYMAPDGALGCYPKAIYGREGLTDVYGNLIVKTDTSDKRSTFWVPTIQK